ncbi:MAG TPA: PAS domain S-box protein, partial [Methylococcales bacterium]|nr:PAS domain S-box protein [Methylococcales bacterium]
MEKQKASLIGQLLLIPLIMVLLAASFLYSRNVVTSSQNELLRTIENETLPQNIELTHLIIQLTQTLRDCNALLVSAQSNHDEESVYLHGKVIINQLHRIEKKGEQLFKGHDDKEVSAQFDELFFVYKGQIITAIEMATVNLNLARAELIRAHEVIKKIDKNFEQWAILSSASLKTAVNQLLTQLEKEKVALLVSFFCLGLLAVGAYVLARRVAQIIAFKSNKDLNHSLEAILASTLDAVIVINQAGVIERYNRAAVDIFGFTEDEAIGAVMAELIIPEKFRAMHTSGLTHYLKTGESNIIGKRIEIEALHKQGHIFAIDMVIAVLPASAGIYFCAFIRDISQLKFIIDDHALDIKSLNQLIDNGSAPIIGINTDDRITLWNKAVEQLTGYAKDEVMGTKLALLVDRGSDSIHQQTLAGQCCTYEMVLNAKEGRRVQLLLSSSPQYNNHGDVAGCVSIGQDVTALNSARLEHENIAAELMAFKDTANAPIFGIDTAGLVNEWNQTAERITGYSKSEVMGRHLVDNFITSDYKVSVEGVLDEALKGKQTTNYEFPLYTKTGARVDVLLNSTTRRDTQGRIVGVVGIGQDVTALYRTRKEFEGKLESAANHDVLTGLPNRRYFYEYLQKQLTAHQGTAEIGTLLFLDLDRFKLVNDSLGHNVGDKLLKIVAQRLLAIVRAGDLVCRLGGDEFVVLLSLESIPRAQAAEQAKKIATKITGVLSQPIHIEEHILSAYSSIGVYCFIRSDSIDEIIMRADNAMYLAKGDVSSHIAFYTDAVHQDLVHQMQVLEGISEALVGDQFVMDYQPQFNHHRELMGVEALIRWQHPQLGMLAPDQFIALAERHHRINEIGAWVIGSVFSQVAQWRQAGLALPKVAINISPMQLLDENFIGVVDQLAQQYRINPEGVVFEITESANIEHFDLIKKV